MNSKRTNNKQYDYGQSLTIHFDHKVCGPLQALEYAGNQFIEKIAKPFIEKEAYNFLMAEENRELVERQIKKDEENLELEKSK